jgi:hypothetical protein
MAAKKKKRVKQEKVIVEFLDIPPKAWSKIFLVEWPPATREAMGLLFAYNGIGPAGDVVQGCWSRAMQINRIMIQHGLPYRIRMYPLPEDERPTERSGYHLRDTQGVKLCTVVKFL